MPAAAFCGTCGAQLTAQRGDGRGRLRMGAYAAAPGEQVLRLSVASSLFPHLPHRSRTPFRVGLAVLLLAMIALALMRWQAPLIAISVLGLPLVYLAYLYEADVHRDLPVRSLALTVVIAVGLGAVWALLTGGVVADFYDVALGAGEPDEQTRLVGLAIPVGSAVLSLVPVVVIRLLRGTTRESLDGFVFGALSAVTFTAAATLTRLAPQFGTGLTTDRPASGLLVQAGIQGVAVPLTAAAMGGLVGAALWFGRPKLLASSVLATLALYAGQGLMEITPLFQGLHFGVHVITTVIALLILRIGLQAALLYEARDPMNPSEHVLCPHCDHVVPDMAFCANCGVAARASSRSSRAARKSPAAEGVSTLRPASGLPAASYEATPVRHTSHGWLLATLGAGMGIAVAAAATVAVLATPVVPRFVCPPDCGRPPIDKPVESTPRFVSQDGEFSVQYPGPGTAYEAKLNPDGVELNFVAGDTGTLELFGLPAANRTPKQITEDLISENYPDATTDYEIPNAMVGYEPGYGVVVDEYPQDSSGTFTRLRLVVMTAVKNDYALVAAAIGPYHEFSPDFGSGHPSGVNLQLAMDMGKYVNSFKWRDDTA
ncbi:zinc ribbon domain-containing protein [Mycobacterium sp.]|uniref:zinc ribbon domain-containing protein n=1 Tax=Mycobacterium sp. TaxID=1785 RepID=UPI002D86D769|nr:zinc ribbon domain-containing protein [Mycobacterium sp.]